MKFRQSGKRYRWLGLVLTLGTIISLAMPASIGLSLSPPPIPSDSAGVLDKQTNVRSNQLQLTKDVRKTVLDNGLVVLTKEVHTAPVVSVQVWYGIGSVDEAPGVNGIAHQLEHMLFKGTQTRPIQFGRLFSALGSNFNAFTSFDHTAYYNTVERNKLTSILTLEADRMRNGRIDARELEGEKRVVISELQGYENSPGFRLDRAVRQALLPGSPYGLTVGGSKADVEKFTVERVKYYYDNYYVPNNATLVVVGDFETDKTMGKIKEIFGSLAKRQQPLPTPPAIAAPSLVPRSITLREPGSTAILSMMYRVPQATDPDVPALDVMSYIMAAGRSSRLEQRIVETGMATSVEAGAANLKKGGWFEVGAVADPSKSLEEIDNAILAELTALREKGVTLDEIKRAQSQLSAAYLLGSRDIGAQARQLGNDFSVTGDYQFTDKYLANVDRVTPADILRVANKYLKEDDRTVGYFYPSQIVNTPPTSTQGNQTSENHSPSTPVDPAEVAKYLPAADPDRPSDNRNLPQSVTLNNGTRVFLLPDPSTPTITLSGNIVAGTEYDRPEKAGTAALVASNLNNGTKNRSALQIASTLEAKGATLGFGASREGVSIGGSALAKDVPIVLDVLSDILQNATFPTTEFETSRQRALVSLKAELDNPAAVARRKFQQSIYPTTHPFAVFPSFASLKAIQTSDLARFYKKRYLPSQTILAIVGDFNVAQMKNTLNNTLGKWQRSGNLASLNYPTNNLPSRQQVFNPSLPSKTQSITIMGNKAIPRKDSRYYAAAVLNQIVGGDTLSSRLGTELRDRQGLTYGVYSAFSAGKRFGTFTVSMQTDPKDSAKAVNSAIAVLNDIRTKGVTAAEVDNAKRAIVSGYAVDLASPDDLVGQTLYQAVYGLDPKEIQEFPKKIQAVRLSDVNRISRELIHPDRFTIVTAGPPQP
jgi:zinc protease